MNKKEITPLEETKELKVANPLPLQKMVDEETANREILTRFITEHMVRGTDYGSITIGGRPSKDCLFKSGAEKFASLMRLRADVVKDNDTWEMAGSKPGLFCYRANLYNQKNELVGMGLGACNVTEKNGNMNNSIKIAKKRAFVDAILTTGALSDFFTQDIDEMSDNGKTQSTSQPSASQSYSQQSFKASFKQINYIKGLINQKGYADAKVLFLKKYDVEKMEDLTNDQASQIISNLKGLPDNPNVKELQQPEPTQEEVDANWITEEGRQIADAVDKGLIDGISIS